MRSQKQSKSGARSRKQTRRQAELGSPERGMKELSEHPPQIDGYQVTHSQTLRYTVTAQATNFAISYTNLLDTILIATGATTGFDLFDTVKIKSVRVWGQGALGTPSSVGTAFFTPTGDKEIHQDTSLGVRPCFVHAKPSKQSLASFYQVSGAGTAFVLTAPPGSIVDVKVVFRTSTAAPTSSANALVGATTGELYYRGLDGIAAATSNFPPPVGIQSI